VLTDRAGMATPVPITPGLWVHPRVSRDGTRVAIESDEGQEANVWIYDLSGASATRRLTFGGHNRFPVWSGDGQRIAFQSDREGDLAIFAQRADGTGAAERLTKPEQRASHVPESWSPDNRTLLFSEFKEATFFSWALSLNDKKAEPFGNVQSAEPIGATFSPDGLWVAYSTNDTPGGSPSSNRGVYVQPFPATGSRYQVPKERSDFHPAWGPAGSELLYTPTSGQLSVVSVRTRPTLTFGRAVGLPAIPMQPRLSTNVRDYDVLPDGRILSTVNQSDQRGSGAGSPQIRVVLNWSEELKQRVPTR